MTVAVASERRSMRADTYHTIATSAMSRPHKSILFVTIAVIMPGLVATP